MKMVSNRLICSDAIAALTTLPDQSIDLIVADPPYNLGKDYGNNKDLTKISLVETHLW